MNRLTILLASALMFCSSAFAQGSWTRSTCPGSANPINARGVYKLSADVVASGVSGDDCVVFQNQNDSYAAYMQYAELDCQGHSITFDASVNYAITATSSSGSIWFHNCIFNNTNSSIAWYAVSVNIRNSSTAAGNYTVSYGNTFYGGGLAAADTPYLLSFYNAYHDNGISVVRSDYFESYGDAVSIPNGSTANTNTGISITDSNHTYVAWGAIYGNGVSLDDGVLLACSVSACTDAIVDSMTIDGAGDAAVEYVGPFSYVQITNNTFSHPHVGGFTCYYSCSLDHSTMSGNSMTNYSNGSLTRHDGGGGSTFFTNNTFTGNSISNDAGTVNSFVLPSSFGGSTHGTFGTTGSNTLTGNNFGDNSPSINTFTLELNDNTGFVDGGVNAPTYNHCYSVTSPNPSQITCH